MAIVINEVMRKIYIALIFTVVLIIVLYFFGVQKTSTISVDWTSFKIKTKYFIGLILLYFISIIILYKIK